MAASALLILPKVEAGNTFLLLGVLSLLVASIIPLLVTAAVTTRCYEMLSLLNAQRAFQEDDFRGMVDPEVDARICTICRYLNCMNSAHPPSWPSLLPLDLF